jgi:enoyl-CoA hydratase
MKNISLNSVNGIVTATLSRPQALNALNFETLNELTTLIKDVYESDAIKGLIITGEGEKAFVAGADIKELAGLDEQTAYDLSTKGQRLFKTMQDCHKPIIAAVNGFALGGGCELAMACHFIIAIENAKFGQPEINLGIIPGYGGTQRLVQLVGRGKALELMLTGDAVSAQEALSMGLINHIVPNRDALMELASKLMAKIVSKAPVAIANIIKSVNAGFGFEEDGYESEAKNFSHCSATSDFKEGTAAFIEKRQPNFKGK